MGGRDGIEYISKDNYQLVKAQVYGELQRKGLADAVVLRYMDDGALAAVDHNVDMKAQGHIKRFIKPEDKHLFDNCESAPDLWTSVLARYCVVDRSFRLSKQRELLNFKWDFKDEDISRYVSRFRRLRLEYRACGDDIPEEMAVGILFNGLSSGYQTAKLIGLNNEEIDTVDKVEHFLTTVEADMESRPREMALTAAVGKEGGRDMRKCWHCGMTGHIERNCRRKKAELAAQEGEGANGGAQVQQQQPAQQQPAQQRRHLVAANNVRMAPVEEQPVQRPRRQLIA